MLIVPETDELSIEVKVAPQDIDQLRPGQDTVLRLSAFNQRTTPELKGQVSLVAADLVTDQRIGRAVLSGADGVRRGRARAARRGQAHARHAGRELHPDARPHGVLLPDQTARRQPHPSLPRRVMEFSQPSFATR